MRRVHVLGGRVLHARVFGTLTRVVLPWSAFGFSGCWFSFAMSFVQVIKLEMITYLL